MPPNSPEAPAAPVVSAAGPTSTATPVVSASGPTSTAAPASAGGPVVRAVLSVPTRADLLGTDTNGVCLTAPTASGQTLLVNVDAAGEGIIRVRLGAGDDLRQGAGRLVTPDLGGGYPESIIEFHGQLVLVHAGILTAEISLDPWHLRFLGTGGAPLVAQERTGPASREPGRGRYPTGSGRTGRAVVVPGPGDPLPFGCSLVDGHVHACHECFAVTEGETFTEYGTPNGGGYAPLYCSSRGYGVLVDSPVPVEFATTGPGDRGAPVRPNRPRTQIVVADDLLDYYLLAGPSAAEVLDRYHRLVRR